MRDPLKDEAYFSKKIAKERKDLELYTALVAETAAAKGEADRGVRNGRLILAKCYDDLIDLQYSAGADIPSLLADYEALLGLYSLTRGPNSGYIGLIKVLSLGVLLNRDASLFRPLEDRILEEGPDDLLVNLLLGHIDSSWPGAGKEFAFPGIYEGIREIAEAGDAARDRLLRYLRGEWYELHSECAWYDSHKSKRNTYTGYWSFESGAIAKILRLDDHGMEKERYYPYDMVHWA